MPAPSAPASSVWLCGYCVGPQVFAGWEVSQQKAGMSNSRPAGRLPRLLTRKEQMGFLGRGAAPSALCSGVSACGHGSREERSGRRLEWQSRPERLLHATGLWVWSGPAVGLSGTCSPCRPWLPGTSRRHTAGSGVRGVCRHHPVSEVTAQTVPLYLLPLGKTVCWCVCVCACVCACACVCKQETV